MSVLDSHILPRWLLHNPTALNSSPTPPSRGARLWCSASPDHPFALVCRLVDDIRSLIREYLTPSLTGCEVYPANAHRKMQERDLEDGGFPAVPPNPETLVPYSDLGASIQTLETLK